MNQKLLKAKTERRKQAVKLLEAQLERNVKPVKGIKPIVGKDTEGNLIRATHVPLKDYEINNIKYLIGHINHKIARAEAILN